GAMTAQQDQTTPGAAPAPAPAQPASIPGMTNVGFDDNLAGDDAVGEPAKVTMKAGEDRLILAWPTSGSEGQYVYRVLHRNSAFTPDPQKHTEEWGATTGNQMNLEADFRRYINTVGVWRYENAPEADGVIHRPGTLHARKTFVSPVLDLTSQLTDNQVNFSWRPLKDHKRGPYRGQTLIYRFEDPDDFDEVMDNNIDFLVSEFDPVEVTTESHYEEYNLPRGTTLHYIFLNEAKSETGTDLYSVEEIRKITVTEILSPPQLDVDSTYDETDSYCSVRFPSVPGKVRLYRTEKMPDANLAQMTMNNQRLTRDMLVSRGLPDSAQLSQAIHTDGEYSVVNRVPWPTGVTTMFLTGVAESGGNIVVGPSVEVQRTGPIENLQCRHHCTWQHLTFSWPQGASEVQVYAVAHGAPAPNPAEGGYTTSINLNQHEIEGGARLNLDTSVINDIYAVPTTMYRGRTKHFPAEKIEVPPLFPFAYHLREMKIRRGLNVFGTKVYKVLLRADFANAASFELGGIFAAVADKAPLARQTDRDMPGYQILKIYPTDELAEAYEVIKVPPLQPGQSFDIGYIKVEEAGEENFDRIRLISARDYEQARHIALRRLGAENFFAGYRP
ncbi:MAG: hypothetical protein Q4P33_06350, partial [Flaviflexus sp.]|nr:hypothetical protein [Flaviflexus sp.]